MFVLTSEHGLQLLPEVLAHQAVQDEVDGGVDDDADVVDVEEEAEGDGGVMPAQAVAVQVVVVRDVHRHRDLHNLHGEKRHGTVRGVSLRSRQVGV